MGGTSPISFLPSDGAAGPFVDATQQMGYVARTQNREKMQKVLFLFIFILASCSGIQSRYHEVGSGESLVEIANKYDVPLRELQAHNAKRVAKGIKTGTKLYIPFEQGASWDGDSDQLAAETSQPTSAVYSSRGIASNAPFLWPCKGFVSSPFGHRHGRPHEGIDIAARQGTPVGAARSGHVIYAGNRISGYGSMVIVRHADTFATVYAHLSKIEVKKGQFVSRGQRVGRVGKTGRATAPHLHFEVRNQRIPVDPLLYLQGQFAANRISSR